MQPNVRRAKIIELLNLRRRETMQNLADEFGVSWDTIQRDITILEQEYPLKITRGNGGGIALPDGYHLTRRHLSARQAQALREVIAIADPSIREALQSILTDFAWSD